MRNSKALGLLLLLLLGFIWGSGYSIAKFAIQHGVPPLGYAFWQSLGPAIVLSMISIGQRSFFQLSLKNISFYLVCGIIGIVIPNTNMYFAAPHLPAGILAVIVNCAPIFTYPLALVASQEKFNYLRLGGVICGISGIFFIIFPHASLPAPAMVPWAVIALLSPLAFASCAVYINANRPASSSALGLSTGMLISSSCLLAPLVFASHNFYPLYPPFNQADFAVLLEIILSSCGYVLFFALLKVAGPVYYSLVGGIVALTGLWWGKIIFDEQLNYWNLVAVILILTGIGLLTSASNKNARNMP